jgi:hypothetical protein
MAVQLNPSKVPIWKSETELQIGISEDAQKLADVTNAQERLIDLLFQGVAEDQLELLGSSVGLTDTETNELVERLKPSLLAPSSSLDNRANLDVRFAEIIRIGFDTSRTPDGVLSNRAATLIQIRKLDRTGLMLLRAFAEAGFRKFETMDFDFVTRNDFGELGYNQTFGGTSRITAARATIEDRATGVEITHASSKPKPKIVLLSAMHQVSPNEYRDTLDKHLAIEYGIDRLRISPVISPGQSACMGCRDLWKSEQEPDWAATSIQLAARHDHLDDAASLLMAASVTCRIVCSHVDGVPESGGVEIDLRSRTVTGYGWQFHPTCPCRKATN